MTFLILFISLTLSPICLTDGEATYQDGNSTEGRQSFKVICQDCFHGEVAFLKISEKGTLLISTRDKRIKTDATLYLDPCQDHQLEVKATMKSTGDAEKVKMLYYKQEACPASSSRGSTNSSWSSGIFVTVVFFLCNVI